MYWNSAKPIAPCTFDTNWYYSESDLSAGRRFTKQMDKSNMMHK